MKNFTQHTLRIYGDLSERVAQYRKDKLLAGESYPSFNEILIELIEVGLNGNDPTSSEQIVSQPVEHTDSEQKKEDPVIDVPEIVTQPLVHTDSGFDPDFVKKFNNLE